ncbi:uncharacterized protein LOC116161203 [Photinus pyralis]|uniref:uncharacterized protein LOC116161203 n=1 Tax=Photinus pyralis TaxID=7054 RepID=UPI00126719E0|nr:uncharacterized protein LOC116161203 [Photinus pyralis]
MIRVATFSLLLVAVQYVSVATSSPFREGGLLDRIHDARQDLHEKIASKFTTTTPKPIELTVWQKIGVRATEMGDAVKKFGDDSLRKMQDLKATVEAQIRRLMRIFERMRRTSNFLTKIVDTEEKLG